MTTLDASQQAAVELVCSARFAVVTGGPGTGKTTCLSHALDVLDARQESYALAAPTGKAARRMAEATGRRAQTVHRLLDFGPDEDGRMTFRRNASTPLEQHLVVVDEASMLDVDLAQALMRAIDPSITRLVLVGDANQLPSVGPGRVFGDLIESEAVPVARLTTLHRAAAESWVCTQAPIILAGSTPDLADRADFRWIERASRTEAVDALIDAVFRDLPSRGVTNAEIQVLIPQRVGPAGCDAVNPRLQTLLNPERDADPAGWTIGKGEDARTLRLRDRVIQKSNDYSLGVMNGEVGEVVSITNEQTTCGRCLGSGSLASHSFDGAKCNDCNGTGKVGPRLTVRYPADDDARDRRVAYSKGDEHSLDLAYALTIHKSQGSQWPWLVVLCHSTHTRMLTRQLLYTGITRAQRGVVLVGDELGLGRAVKETRDSRRNTGLISRVRAGVSAPTAAATSPELPTFAPAATSAPESDPKEYAAL